MKRKYLIRNNFNTSRLTRLLAKAVDIFIVLILSFLFYPFGLVLALVYVAISDSLSGGQSVGKKLLGFAVISLEDGSPCSLKQSTIRNLPLLLPMFFALIPFWGWIISSILSIPLIGFEIYLMLKLESAHRLGDVMADTTVIANDENRADIKNAKNGWFDSHKKMSPCNRSVM